MSGRIIAIGDIHGFSTPLRKLLEQVSPGSADTIVTLGDYCDRGPDTKGVLEELIALRQHCRLIPLMGNHDEMLLDALAGKEGVLETWLFYGGRNTLWSYDAKHPRELPEHHIQFLQQCQNYFETSDHFFAHANYLPHLPLEEQPVEVLRWWSLRDFLPGPHTSGKKAILGHTSQRDHKVLDLGHLACIDTYCYGGGWLTALDVTNGCIWQADQQGKLRRKEMHL